MAKVFLDKEYIEKEAALEIIQSISPPSWDAISRTAAYCEIKYLSPADVKPVVRGEWIWDVHTGRYHCSRCGELAPLFKDGDDDYIYNPNFCPDCGADMRKEGEDEIN